MHGEADNPRGNSQAAGRSGQPKEDSRGRRGPTLRKKLLLLLCTILFLVALLGLGEIYCRLFTDIHFLGNSRNLFVANAFGPSRGNARNCEGISFGVTVYTDEHGFRIDPHFKDPDSSVAVLILGDSVSFACGLAEEQSCVGRLRRAMPTVRFYNSSVIGYSAPDYKNVIDHFLPHHPEVKCVYLLLCLNDVSRASAARIEQELSKDQPAQDTDDDLVQRAKRVPFLTRINEFLRSRSKLYLFGKNAFTDPSLRYYRAVRKVYAQGDRVVEASLRPLDDIGKRLRAGGVRFKILILPYEAQLRSGGSPDLAPQEAIRKHLDAWQIEYIDAAGPLLGSGVPSEKLYLYSDPMHFSAAGHRVLAEILRDELTQAGTAGASD